MNHISQLVDLLKLEELKPNVFKGHSKPIGSPNVFGGQVLAQALYAASQTVPEERKCNSYHCYFILPGDLIKPIIFEVENIRDGGSFSIRRVIAKQDDKVIYFMGASFHAAEEGYEHQIKMPTHTKHHSELLSWDELYEQLQAVLPEQIKAFFAIERPIIFKPVVLNNPLEKKKLEPIQEVWFKLKGETENNAILNRSILSYISDYNILTTALYPHADVANISNTQMATLDHSMWYFRETDINGWFLFQIESPSTSDARGFTRGNIFDEKGNLILSVTQEGLMRPKK